MADPDVLFEVMLNEPSGSSDELTSYLVMPRVTSVLDPIKYWHVLLPSPLAHMALDLLTVPGEWCTCTT